MFSLNLGFCDQHLSLCKVLLYEDLYSFWFGLRNSYLVILKRHLEDMSQLSYLLLSFFSLPHLFDGELEIKEGPLSELIFLSTDLAVAKEFWCGCIILNMQGQEILKCNFYVCACWEHQNKFKAWECLVHMQSVPEHQQHKQGTNPSSMSMVATGLPPFLAIFFLPSLSSLLVLCS